MKTTTELAREAYEIAKMAGDGDVYETFRRLCIEDYVKEAPAAQVPDCSKCANRGKVEGLSQETYCEHCKHHYSWLADNFAAAPQEGK